MRKLRKKYGATWVGIAVGALALFVLAGRVGRLEATTSQRQTAYASASRDAHDFVSRTTLHIAIADFDGDLQPDVATVESGSVAASHANYRIRFELSQGIDRSIGVTAAAGGLQIWPQDVNGDSFLDLMISTKWLHEPVAILLNDGHGNFTVATPGDYPRSVWNHEVNWESAPENWKESSAILTSRIPEGASEEIRRNFQPQLLQESLKFAETGNAGASLCFSSRERAPPA